MTNTIAEAPVVDLRYMAVEACPESVEALQQNLHKAEVSYASARAEAERLNKLRSNLSGQIADLDTNIKKLRGQAFSSMAEEKFPNAPPLFERIEKLKLERNRLIDSMSYVASFAFENAVIAELSAQIAEREATALLFEGQAVDIRTRAAEAASLAARIDPGFTMNLKDSQSQKLLETAKGIRGGVDELRTQLQKKIGDVAREQALVAPRLFNS